MNATIIEFRARVDLERDVEARDVELFELEFDPTVDYSRAFARHLRREAERRAL